LIHSRDSTRVTDGILIATATYYKLLDLLIGFAQISGNEPDVAPYQVLRDTIRQAFNRRFFNPAGAVYSNGTVTANLLPLSFGLVPAGREAEVFNHIVHKILVENRGHISTGVIGTQWLMRGLSRHGRPDIACRLATTRSYRRRGHMAANGATTIWELWNGNTANPGMNSQNHVMLLGDLLIWYFEDLAGIKALEPAFKYIRMRPGLIDGLDEVKASHRCPYGEILSHWR